MPTVFKVLGRDDVQIRPFAVHKTHVITFTSGSGSVPAGEMNIATGIASSSLNDFDPNKSAQNDNGTYQIPLYSTVKNTFYTSGSAVVVTGSEAWMNWSAGGDFNRKFPLSSSVHVVNIPQNIYGEGVRRGTFQLSAPSAGTGTLVDDGKGRLYVSQSASGSDKIVGNMFYKLGVAVVNRLESAGATGELIQDNGLYIDNGDAVQATFDSTQTLYEYSITATAEPSEFNYTLNTTAHNTASVNAMASGTLSPYITTVGLYDNKYRLVAVAKLPRPIKRLSRSAQSFVIRFDL